MSSKSVHDLPAEVEASLVRMGDELAKGQVSDAALAVAVSALSGLPPQIIGWADAKIARFGQLARREDRGRLGLLNLIHPRLSALNLLDQRHKLALVFVFHRDGYVRERALNYINAVPASPFFVAALAWRLNDWVLPVRLAARRCAQRVFPTISADVIAASAPFLLDRWRWWARWDDQSVALVDRVLERPDVTAALVDWFCIGTTGPLAKLLRFAMRGPGLDAHLSKIAQDAVTPPVRLVALRSLIEARASWPIGFGREWIDKRYGLSRRVPLFAHRAFEHPQQPRDLILEAVDDRSPAVRRMAVDALIERQDLFPDIDEIAAVLATDASLAVRDRAGFIMRTRDRADNAQT
jgi:hypothetical protein